MPHKDPVKHAEYMKKYRESRREEARERSRLWREADPERLKKSQHNCYLKHRESKLAAARKYREEHAEEIALWKAQNRDILRERDHASYQKHREARLAADRAYRQTPEGRAAMVRQALRHRVRNPLKWHARVFLRKMVALGHVQKLPCSVCSTTEDVHAHHDDYTKPLDVIWLCRKHHQERHKSIPANPVSQEGDIQCQVTAAPKVQ